MKYPAMNDYTAATPPFARKEERMVTEALQSAVAPSSVIRGMVRRPLFLPRYGYPTVAPTVEAVLSLSRVTSYNTNYTGGAWDINAAARNSGYSYL